MSIFQFDGEQITAHIPHPSGPFASARFCRVPERFRAGVAAHMASMNEHASAAGIVVGVGVGVGAPKPRMPAKAPAKASPAPASAPPRYVPPTGKRYEEMTAREKIVCRETDRDLFDRLRADAVSRGVVDATPTINPEPYTGDASKARAA